jgi:hypothetical protein
VDGSDLGLFLPLALDDMEVGSAQTGPADLHDHILR